MNPRGNFARPFLPYVALSRQTISEKSPEGLAGESLRASAGA
jgi:hypothetical protein